MNFKKVLNLCNKYFGNYGPKTQFWLILTPKRDAAEVFGTSIKCHPKVFKIQNYNRTLYKFRANEEIFFIYIWGSGCIFLVLGYKFVTKCDAAEAKIRGWYQSQLTHTESL